jgi:hypothetical protein
MGYSGVLVFWCIAWLTVLYGQKVGNPLEIGSFSVADSEFEPWGITADFQLHPSRIWLGACRFQDRSGVADVPAFWLALVNCFRYPYFQPLQLDDRS